MSATFEQIERAGHERVVFCRDRASGLRAIIAIHDTTLGPALGGVRMRPYASEDEALDDVLRLSRGMTYKAAISGVSLGGGKSVIVGDAASQKTAPLLRAMGRHIDALGGAYIGGQDIGTDSRDMAVIREATRHVSCVHETAGGAGDPSHATAYGVICGIRAALKVALGSDDLRGRHIAVQGLGNVGMSVARYCAEAGATLSVADVAAERVDRAVQETRASAVLPDTIYDVECDVFAPCSIGAVVNDATLGRLRCAAIVGGANNVLAEPRHGDELAALGIVYGPDYLVNSGGLIRCQEEVRGAATDDATIFPKIDKIYDQTLEILRLARQQGISSEAAADRVAEDRLEAVARAGEAWNPLRSPVDSLR